MKINFRLSLQVMKLTKNFYVATTTALFFVVCMTLLASCVKEDDHDTYAAEDATYALWVYDDIINIANEAITLGTGENLVLYKTTGYCSRVINTPGHLIISFGGDNCLCNDGRMRRGKIIVDYEGDYHDSLAVHEFSFDNYFVNDNEIRGTQTLTNIGVVNGVPLQELAVQGEVDIWDSLGELTYNAEITRRFVAGSETAQWGDDVYELTGTAQGVNIYGNNYAFNALEPIIKTNNLDCRFFTQGILEVQPQGRTFRSIDFGTGQCDDHAIVTIDRKQHNIILQ